MSKQIKIDCDVGLSQRADPRHIGELVIEFLHSDYPLASYLRQGIVDNSHTPLEDWLTGPVVEDMLDISTRKLQTLRSNGSLPYSKLGGKIFYKRVDVERLLESGYTCDKKLDCFTLPNNCNDGKKTSN